MVVVVRIPRMAHEGINNIREERVDQTILRSQDAFHVDILMFHERVAARIPDVHDPVKEAMDPAEVVAIEIKRTGDRGRQVKQEMRDHHDVGWKTCDLLSPANIRLE